MRESTAPIGAKPPPAPQAKPTMILEPSRLQAIIFPTATRASACAIVAAPELRRPAFLSDSPLCKIIPGGQSWLIQPALIDAFYFYCLAAGGALSLSSVGMSIVNIVY